MRRKYIIPFLIIVCIVLLLGCNNITNLAGIRGSGDVVEEERDVSGFSQVELASFGTLDIEFGDEEELIIEAEDNLMEYFITEVSGDELTIRVKRNTTLRPRKKVKFHLKAKKLDKFTISGSGKIEAPEIAIDEFNIVINGSGKVNIDDLEAKTLDIEIGGSGDITIDDGQVNEQKLKVSGSGEYRARNLVSEEADIGVSGSGKATVNVSDKLKVDISGSGNVRYVGNPSVDSNISGSGKVQKLSD